MIGAQQVVDTALAEAARLGKADETIVLVTDRADAVAAVGGQFDDHQRRFGEPAHHGDFDCAAGRYGARRLGEVQRGRPGGDRGLVAASQQAALRGARGPRQRAAAAGHRRTGRLGRAGAGDRRARSSPASPRRWRRAFAARTSCTATPGTSWRRRSSATSTGLRRRYTQPTGSVEINAKRDGASAWAGVSTPDFVDVPTDSHARASCRRGWAGRGAPSSCPPDATRRSCRRRRWPT